MNKRNLITGIVIIFFATFLCRLFLADHMYLLNSRITDIFFKVKHYIQGTGETSPHFEVFAIGDRDIDALEISLYDRNIFGEFIKILSQYKVKTILYDIIFEHYQSEQSDTYLIKSTEQAGNVIYPVSMAHRNDVSIENFNNEIGQKCFWFPDIINPGKPGIITSCITPFDELATAARGLGVFDYDRDADGVARRIPLIFFSKKGYVPSIVLAAIADFFNVTPGHITISFGKYIKLMNAQLPSGSVRDLSIPIDMKGRMHVNFIGPYTDSFRYSPVRELIRFDEQMEEHQDYGDMLEGCLIIISEASSREPNNVTTVFDKVVPHSEVLAHAINTILTENFIYHAGPTGFESLLCSFLFFSLLAVILLLYNDHRFFILSILTMVLYVLLVFFLFFLFNRIMIFMPDFPGFICLLLLFSVNRYIIVMRERKVYQHEYEKIRESTGHIRDQLKEIEKSSSITINNKTYHINEKACHEFYVTPAQKKILMLLLQGYRYRDIGAALGIAEGTVKSQVSRLKESTKAYDRSSLIKIFFSI